MLLNHVFGMFTHPDDEWKEIRKEHASPVKLYGTYIALLALISPICAYISTTQFGWQVGDGQLIKLTSSSAFQLNVVTYIAAVSYTHLTLPTIYSV